MTNDTDAKPIIGQDERKDWHAPTVRSVIPSRRTRGGNISSNFEAPVYDIS